MFQIKILIMLLALTISVSAQEQTWMRPHAKAIDKAEREVRKAKLGLAKAYQEAKDDCLHQIPGGMIISDPDVFKELKCMVRPQAVAPVSQSTPVPESKK